MLTVCDFSKLDLSLKRALLVKYSYFMWMQFSISLIVSVCNVQTGLVASCGDASSVHILRGLFNLKKS